MALVKGERMKGRIIKIWADVALTEADQRFYLWEATGEGYNRNIKPDGFETEQKARSYAIRRDRLKLVADPNKPD